MAVLPTGIGPVTGGYQIERSLRFNSADSAYLNRTPASAGNRQKWTFNCWFKLSALNQDNAIFSAGNTTYYTTIRVDSNNELVFYIDDSAAYSLFTTQLFRDVSAWYNLTIAFDTTQATASNRVKIYINGSQITAFRSSSYPVQNYSGQINNNVAHAIGRREASASQYFSGYQTETYFIDGQALTPSDFGETDSATGVWKPKAYSGTYGTNGFYLKFADNSNTTAGTLGKDSSGNGNNWTPNNFSVTAGVGNDSLVDSPTSYGTDTGVGGEVRGNYCTLNPLIIVPAGTVSNGNLDYNRGSTASHGSAAASFTLPTTGKWYWEVRACKSANNEMIGVANIQNNPQLPATGSEIGTGSRGDYGYRSDGNKYNNGSQGAYGATYTSGDIIGVAWDSDAGTLVFYKNGTSQGTAFSSITQVVGKFAPAVSSAETSPDSFNFGQRAFAYTAPSGFKALCTQNLPTPTIGATSTTQANDYFGVTTWTGNGGTLTVSGLEFTPEAIWIKRRDTSNNHRIVDVVRGYDKEIYPNLTNAEATFDWYSSITSTGYVIDVSDPSYNANAGTYVAWNWKANGAGSSNTAGTITSTVSANTTSGFSIVTYTAPSSGAFTVGHGLGVAPAFIITKSRSNAYNWGTYHQSIGNTGRVDLNSTSGTTTTQNSAWNNTSPTSTVFSMGSDWAGSGITYVAYCFAPVAGYSAFGSYTGNGSTDGPFVYTGFRPRYVLIKDATNSATEWGIEDTVRDTDNPINLILQAETSAAEATATNRLDILSNGFKIRSTGFMNTNNATIIYAAFAETPAKFSLAR